MRLRGLGISRGLARERGGWVVKAALAIFLSLLMLAFSVIASGAPIPL